MTRRAGITVVATAIIAASAAIHEETAHAFATILKAPASLCQNINGVAYTPANPQIQSTESDVGRFYYSGGSLKVYCPIIDMPTVLDMTDVNVADRVSILYWKNNGNMPATAQLCSEDNLGWSIGGSCDNAVTSQVGEGVSTIELTMTTGTNWQVNSWSLHYIYVYIPGFGDIEEFSGYTIWHS